MPDNQYLRDASGRLCFEMFLVPACSYDAVTQDIAAKFELVFHNSLVSSILGYAFQDYRSGEHVVGLEWDNWTGFSVVAKTPESEVLLREIGSWLLESPWANLQ